MFNKNQISLMFSVVFHQQPAFFIAVLVFFNQHVPTLMGVCFFFEGRRASVKLNLEGGEERVQEI